MGCPYLRLLKSRWLGREDQPPHPAQAAAFVAEPVTSTTPVWHDITFSNITAVATVAGGAIWGRPEMLVSNVSFVHVDIIAPGTFNIYNARGIRFQDCHIRLKGRHTFTLYNADVVVTNTVNLPSAAGQK